MHTHYAKPQWKLSSPKVCRENDYSVLLTCVVVRGIVEISVSHICLPQWKKNTYQNRFAHILTRAIFEHCCAIIAVKHALLEGQSIQQINCHPVDPTCFQSRTDSPRFHMFYSKYGRSCQPQKEIIDLSAADVNPGGISRCVWI